MKISYIFTILYFVFVFFIQISFSIKTIWKQKKKPTVFKTDPEKVKAQLDAMNAAIFSQAFKAREEANRIEQ